MYSTLKLRNRWSMTAICFMLLLVLIAFQSRHKVSAQGVCEPDYMPPPGNFVTSRPYYGNAFGQQNILLYDYAPIMTNLNGDQHMDFLYQLNNQSWVEIGNGSGWDRVYDCNYTGGLWVGDCDCLNP